MGNKRPKTIGVIGGMGPRATVMFEQSIMENMDARVDADFPSVITYNNSQIPDRTDSLLNDDGREFAAEAIRTGKILIASGAEILVMPCNTAHARYAEIQSALSKPLINMVECVMDVVKKSSDVVAILGTDGTLREHLYERACFEEKIKCYLPNTVEQTIIMNSIYLVKNGKLEESVTKITPIIKKLEKKGIKRVLLACTELSLIQKMIKTDMDLIDSLEILAKAVISCSHI